MQCPRCKHEWDVRQSPCPRCSLHIRAPEQQGALHRQMPDREVPLDGAVLASPGERTGRVRSGQPPELASSQRPRLSFPPDLHELHLSGLPTTSNLNPAKRSSISQPLNPLKTPSTRDLSLSGTQAEIQPLLAGSHLHRDRYSLQKTLQRKEWPLGIVETTWVALDTRFARSLVMIYELSIPGDAPKEFQTIPYTATRVFTSIGRHPHILDLRDVFREKGRSFFIFEPIYGPSLLTLARKNGGTLPEREVIACCLQITQLLDLCAQQSPPLIHGNIRAEYIIKKPADARYVLTNFSTALAGGLVEIMAEREKTPPWPANLTELNRDALNGQADLSALLVMAHSLASGRNLADTRIARGGPDISRRLSIMFIKGLSSSPYQRYHTPSELYQDLLALYKEHERIPPAQVKANGSESARPFVLPSQESKPEALTLPAPVKELSEPPLLVPHPEDFPILKDAPDMRNAILWFVGMLLCFLIFLVGRGLI